MSDEEIKTEEAPAAEDAPAKDVVVLVVELVDAHVQFNGATWNVYIPRNPALQCETEDHSTCKAAAKRIQAERDLQVAADRKERESKAQAEAESQAAAAAAAAAQAAVLERNRAKSDKIRAATLEKISKVDAAKAAADEAADKASKTFHAVIDRIRQDLVRDTAAAEEEHKARLDAIEAGE